MNKEYYDKNQVLKELLNKANKKFYDLIVKANFLDDLLEMICSKCIISITLDDILAIDEYELVSTLSANISNIDDNLHIKTILDKIPNYCLINFIGSNDLELKDISDILKRIESMYPDIKIKFGSYLNKDIDCLCKVQALFMCK